MTPDLVGRVRRAGRELRLRSLVVTRADPRGTVTVAGLDALRSADVVLYDRLAKGNNTRSGPKFG